ncbi:MAG TPA: SRPBCC family protein [Thermoanaerobaculia bacterium]|nr:SRPBCC family protein [Thermoanaerobaculia bacterium]
MANETDRIQKQILLHAPRARVWRALTDSDQFGAWFGMKSDVPFTPGAAVHGTVGQTTVDPEVAALQKPYEGLPFEITIDRIEPERLFSFRWHPNAVEPGVDYSGEPTTLVVFELEEVEGGVLLTVTESGFDRIPIERRAKAFSANEGGWGMVVHLIEKYLAQAA